MARFLSGCFPLVRSTLVPPRLHERPTTKKTASPPARGAMPASAPRSAAWRRASRASVCSARKLDRAGNALGAGRRARRAQRSDHEGGAAAGHHSRCAAAGICRRTDEAAEPGAADGLGVRQAPHAGRARRRLAKEVRRVSSIIRQRPLRSARCIARRRSTGAALACKLQYPDMQSAVEADLSQLQLLLRSAGASIRRSTPARSPRRSARGLREELDYEREASHIALYRDMLDGTTPSACRRSGRSSRPAGC